MNISIIGTGVFGLSIASSLACNKNNSILMYSESLEDIKKFEESRKYYEPLKCSIDSNISFTNSYKEALESSDIVFIMVSSKYINLVIDNISKYINKSIPIIVGTKGFDEEHYTFIHETLNNHNLDNIGILSGASFAKDVASSNPIGLVLAVTYDETFKLVKSAFFNTNIHLVKSNDIIGTQLCGAIKNVFAIATGILNGLGYGESSECMMLTNALNEMKQIIKSLKGDENLILSYAGVADLFLTATSTSSRNYTYGTYVGKNELEMAKNYLNEFTVEGYNSLLSIKEILRKKNISNKLIDLLYEIIENKKNPTTLVEYLNEE